MFEVRIHGRGGQGAVTAADILAIAVIREGKYAQSMPAFGAERRGAPVLAFCRISEKFIRIRSEIYKPDIVIVLDPTLLDTVDVKAGLDDNGVLVLNTKLSPQDARRKLGFNGKAACVDATKIALETLGVPITNTTMLGAFAKAVNVVKLESLKEALEKRLGKTTGEKNFLALKEAYERVKVGGV